MDEWCELSKFVLNNWDELFFNACLISGQTANLGIEVEPIEADYYAPERIWVYFNRENKDGIIEARHEVELHRSLGVKYIDAVRCYNSDDRKYTPRDVIEGVNIEVAKRALCILGMQREII